MSTNAPIAELVAGDYADIDRMPGATGNPPNPIRANDGRLYRYGFDHVTWSSYRTRSGKMRGGATYEGRWRCRITKIE